MHVASNRVFSLFTSSVIVLGASTFVMVMATWISNSYKEGYIDKLSAEAKLHRRFERHSASRSSVGRSGSKDIFRLSFDLQADLRPVFDWNVKQLFVYLVAEYSSPGFPLTQAVIWDKIVQTRKEAVLDYHGNEAEYYLTDDNLRGKDIRLKLKWNVIPYVGLLYDISSFFGSYELELPTEPGQLKKDL